MTATVWLQGHKYIVAEVSCLRIYSTLPNVLLPNIYPYIQLPNSWLRNSDLYFNPKTSLLVTVLHNAPPEDIFRRLPCKYIPMSITITRYSSGAVLLSLAEASASAVASKHLQQLIMASKTTPSRYRRIIKVHFRRTDTVSGRLDVCVPPPLALGDDNCPKHMGDPKYRKYG